CLLHAWHQVIHSSTNFLVYRMLGMHHVSQVIYQLPCQCVADVVVRFAVLVNSSTNFLVYCMLGTK
ncbi:MAG: hypothetical protein ACK55Z_26200, partial [bacterium]